MNPRHTFPPLLLIALGCQSLGSSREPIPDSTHYEIKVHAKKDTVPVIRTYTDLVFDSVEKLAAARHKVSIIQFNRLQALCDEPGRNERLRVDQSSRKISREFKFKPSKGTGWDYVKEKAIPSLQEKPVEACLSHDDRILWVSLHNAEGIVPIRLDSVEATQKKDKGSRQAMKQLTVIYPGQTKKDTIEVPLIHTGKTPKVIARTSDSRYLMVSNWHSYTVSVLEMQIDSFPFAKVLQNIPVSAIPRGIAIDSRTNRSYIAIMGGASISVIDNAIWEKVDDLNVASNPRHVVLDTSGRLFVSYNRLARVACLDAITGKTLFTAETHSQPRTIVLSKDGRFLFVTCYSGDTLDVFKIGQNEFTKVTSLPCVGHPVGVDIFENDNKLEAWVCSYSTGSISIFSFKKKYSD